LTARNRFPMPFMLDDAAAATRIAHGLARDRARIAFPRRLYAVVWFLAAMPPGLADRLLAGRR
ncbi:MAG: short-chain dehydrogenase, partial [Geminicoccaceae bacterium]